MFRLLKNNIGAADYPAAKKTFTDPIDGSTVMVAAQMIAAYDEVEAIQTFLGSLGAGNTQSYSAALLDALQGLRIGTELSYVGVAELSVAAGRIIFEAGGKYRMRENTSATSVGWADIDTGAEDDVQYYVYAVADAEATTFTVQVSINATTPDSGTYYKRIGSFVNNTDITKCTVEDDLYIKEAREVDTVVLTDTTTAVDTWADLDLSAWVGARKCLVFLYVTMAGLGDIKTRENGKSEDQVYSGQASLFGAGTGGATIDAGHGALIQCITDSAGIIEWATVAEENMVITLEGFIVLSG